MHAQSAAPYHSRHTLGLGTRAASTRPPLARALARALTPPRFPSLLVFLETLLSVPLPLGRKCS